MVELFKRVRVRGWLGAWFSMQLAAALGVVGLAQAASLQEVQGFGMNPANTRMFAYVPDKLAAAPPILVAIHYCGGNANGYFNSTGYRGLADRYGFIVIYPQTTSSDGCFDVHSEATLKHDGGGDSLGIASMVRYTITKYSADPKRVYVAGTSSGAMMTNVLLGAYPDLFSGGAAFAGVPFACFAGQGAWNSACSSGQTTKTGQQWGDLVRAAYPGYTGPRPRVQLWHGDRDETLNFHNFGEAIKQWTNVLGVSEMPTSTEQNAPQARWTRTRYADAGGVVRVEGIVEAGVTHNLMVPADEVIRFFGLDGTEDPGAAVGGSGGSSGAAGTAGAGGDGGSGGGAAGRRSGMGDAGRAGSPPSAGASANAGAGAAGAGTAGTTGRTTGSQSAAGASAPIAGAGVAGAAGGMSVGEAGAAGAVSGVPIEGDAARDSSDGGSCSVRSGSTSGSGSAWWMAIGLLAMLSRRRRRNG